MLAAVEFSTLFTWLLTTSAGASILAFHFIAGAAVCVVVVDILLDGMPWRCLGHVVLLGERARMGHVARSYTIVLGLAECSFWRPYLSSKTLHFYV
jgi:hypothetical protein